MQTLDRLVGILEYVSSATQPPVLSDVARGTGLSVSSCHRLLGELVGAGLLTRSPIGRGYIPGPRLVHLARDARTTASETKVDLALRELVALWDETFYFVRMNGTQPEVSVERSPEGVQRSLAVRRVWRPFSAHAGAGARAMLAFASPDQREHVLADATFERYTEFTKTELAAVLAELDRTRERGYGRCDQEFDIGVMSLAVPIRSGAGMPVAAIGVIGARERIMLAQERGLIDAMQTVCVSLAASDLFEGVN